MSSVASVLSATAASIAAVLTAINLYVTGRRERAKWAREALVDAFIAFLDESFKAKDHCKTVCRLEREYDISDEQRGQIRADIHKAIDEMYSQLSRLRLLAPQYVVGPSTSLAEANRQQ